MHTCDTNSIYKITKPHRHTRINTDADTPTQCFHLSTGDLPRLGQAKELFANKFYLHEDRLVIGCLEEKIFNDTRDKYLGVRDFNTSFYEHLNFVQDQVE